ncbi:MAG: hypothetical protein JWQ43_1886 [Glaciihabitans sp.]|nr:hypothetical protein [Glaciihabitans sp.]
MTDPRDLRRAELIAAAIAGQLTDAEGHELDALRAGDPTIDDEIRFLSATADDLASSVSGWDTSLPSADLRSRIAAIAAEDPIARGFAAHDQGKTEYQGDVSAAAAPVRPAPAIALSAAPSRRGRWIIAVAAAACIGIGAGVGIGLTAATPSAPQAGPSSVVTGPPGTLGAVETISFDGSPTNVQIDGALIAHTWGTETVLHITGLPADASYGLVLVTDTGEELDSGSFLGSDVAIDCEMNAAVMRASVTKVLIQDADGTAVATAELPSVS